MAVSGEEMPPVDGQSYGVKMGVDAAGSRRPQAHEAYPIADEGGLLPLLDGFDVDFWDETGQAHTRQEFGVDLIALVGGVGDGSQALGMGKDDMNARALQEIEDPWPGGTGFNDDLYRLVLFEETDQAIGLLVADPGGPVDNVAGRVDDGDHNEGRMGIDSSDEHGWPPLGMASWNLEQGQRTSPSP